MATSLGSSTTKIVLLIAWIVILLVVYGAVPKPLDDWAMLCLGFILGALFLLLKERT